MVPAVAAVCRQPKAAPACSSYELPITREELGDTLGLSTVPCEPNAATALRAENLITLKSGHVVILDQDRLFEFSGFNPNYLHLSTGAAANRIRTSLADTPRAPRS